MSALDTARRVLRLEAQAILALEARLDETFTLAVQLVRNAPGRVITSGIGKSGLVARKVAATLTATGTPAEFIHPVDALHGDLGHVGPHDIAILLSHSGESADMAFFAIHLTEKRTTVIALTRPGSWLARNSAIVLDCSVEQEACATSRTPTASSTAMLALGDAIAVALVEARGLTREQIARLHPAGELGRTLNDDAAPSTLFGRPLRESDRLPDMGPIKLETWDEYERRPRGDDAA